MTPCRSVTIASAVLLVLFANLAHAGQWSSWQTTNCYDGIDYRVKYNRKTTIAGKHEWGLQIRNRYREKMRLSWELTETGTSNVDTSNRSSLGAGESLERSYFLTTGPGGRVLVWIDGVKFVDDSDYYGCDR